LIKSSTPKIFENCKAFKNLIDLSFDFVFLLEPPSGKIISANQKACQDLGYSHRELLSLNFNNLNLDEGPRLDDLFNPIHGLDANDFKTSRFKDKCGDVFPVEWMANSFVENEEAYVVVSVKKILGEEKIQSLAKDLKIKSRESDFARAKAELAFESLDQMVEDRTRELIEINEQLRGEIVERKIAEQEARQFSDIMDNSIDEIYVFYASSLKLKKANFGAQSNLDYSMKELLDLTPYDLIAQGTQEKFEETIEPLRKSKKDQIIFQAEHKRKDGSLYPVEIRLQLMKDEKPPVFVALTQDISERKRSEEKIIFALEAAERASKVKSEFLSRMSHELRTPMNSILGFAQVLKMNSENSLTGHQQENLDRILSSGNHLLNLVNNVLDISTIDAEQVKLDIETVDFVSSVKNVLSTCKILAAKKQVSILSQGFETNCYFIDADKHRLQQSIFHLISNAIKYNKPDGYIEVSFEKQGNDKIRLGIRDTGYGISDEMKEKLFEPFELSDTPLEIVEGLGIGLTLSKKFIEMMNGSIGFESKYGEGSFFYIDLPLSKNAPTSLQNECY
jgi:PAS domain S-box-containing protein